VTTPTVPYVDLPTLRSTLGATTQAALLPDVTLSRAIGEAQGEVDGRLANRYSTPFTNPPELVVACTRDIAAYLATLTARNGDPLVNGEPIALRYSRAEVLLGQLVSGQIGTDNPAVVVDSSSPEAVNPGYDGQLFGPQDVGMRRWGSQGWVPASDWPYGQDGGGYPPSGYSYGGL